MILTKLWAALLACLATACLAGMFLLSLRSSTGFSDEDKQVIRAVTEAGLAAIAADIESSPVSLGPSLLNDTRLRNAMDDDFADRRKPGQTLSDVFIEVANEGLLREYPAMSVAIVAKDGTILARTGLEEDEFDQVVKLADFQTAQKKPTDSLFSTALNETLHAIKVSRRDLTTLERRLVAIQTIDLGGGSFFRRVLGTAHPAGLVRSGELVGDPIGGANPDELAQLVAENLENVPPEGASPAFLVGTGREARIGAIGRVPGPAGKGDDGTVFGVVSLATAGARQHDLAQALAQSQEDGLVAQLNWPALGGLLAVALTLCFFFPYLEATAPLRRLTAEFENLEKGKQHQLYQETYSGQIGQLARTAVRAHAVIRSAADDDEFGEEAEEPDEAEEKPLPSPPRRSTSSSRRHARRHGARSARHAGSRAIEVPSSDDEAVVADGDQSPGSDSETPGADPANEEAAPAEADVTQGSDAPETEPTQSDGTPGPVLSDPTPDDPVLEGLMGSISSASSSGRAISSEEPDKEAPPASASQSGSARAASTSGPSPLFGPRTDPGGSGRGVIPRFKAPTSGKTNPPVHSAEPTPEPEPEPAAEPEPEPAPKPAPKPAPEPEPEPAADDAGDDREAYYREIYEQFVQTKLACGESTNGFTFEKFARKLRQNTETLMRRPEATNVTFTVYVKNGVAALKAKLVKT